ncbi:MAG TPA: Holliday junction resolvase RuvX, partial [Saprospiraceae bacterium]|nr:Holliday junction resolvase RuvX [Saprospiraceae bacterium]
MGIDYGGKRSGISVTDPLQIIVTGLTTVDTKNLFQEIENYLSVNDAEKIV